MDKLLVNLGHEIQDVDEEVFDLFSQSIPSIDLGMLDPKTDLLEVTIGTRDFEITQSPGILQSQRGGGTTGAAVWQSSVRFASWINSPTNVLSQSGVLTSESTVLELGAGISGLLPCILSERVRRTVSTDQAYILKTLKENITRNERQVGPSKKGKSSKKQERLTSSIDLFALDWEKDDVPSLLRQHDLESGVDVLFACDCVYNYALVEPFVQTCKDVCSLRDAEDDTTIPTICVIVQQLRQPEILDQWLTAFLKSFRTWRIPSELLSDGLKENSGFVVHVGILRKSAGS